MIFDILFHSSCLQMRRVGFHFNDIQELIKSFQLKILMDPLSAIKGKANNARPAEQKLKLFLNSISKRQLQ